MTKCNRALGMLVNYANKTKEVKDFIADWQSVIQFDLRGEEPFYVKAQKGELSMEVGRHLKPDVVFEGSSDVFFDILTNQIDPDDAFLMKRYEIIGSIFDAIRFRHLAELTQNAHKTTFSVLRRLSRVT